MDGGRGAARTCSTQCESCEPPLRCRHNWRRVISGNSAASTKEKKESLEFMIICRCYLLWDCDRPPPTKSKLRSYEASSTSPRTIKRLELEIIFHGSNHYTQKASAFIGNGHKQIHKEKWSGAKVSYRVKRFMIQSLKMLKNQINIETYILSIFIEKFDSIK